MQRHDLNDVFLLLLGCQEGDLISSRFNIKCTVFILNVAPSQGDTKTESLGETDSVVSVRD